MAWYNVFKKASEIGRLTNELDFSRRQLEFAQDRIDAAEIKIDLLEKSVKSERDKRDKFVYVAMDRLTVKSGGYGAFEKALAPKAPEKLPEYTDDGMEAKIQAAAKLQMEIDPDPRELEFYLKAVRDDPERYMPQ